MRKSDLDQFPNQAVLGRYDRVIGFVVAFDYRAQPLTEMDQFFRKTRRGIVPLTVKEILEELIAGKLA